MHTVKQVAQLAGVSIRTLHHYDDIGLLEPAHVGDNGYRYYGREELLRLQQILIHRELGIPLAEIGGILDDPAFDRLEALKNQRERLAGEAERLAEMLRTIDRTIAEIKGDHVMKDNDLYSGVVDPKKQDEYEAWLEEKYGQAMKERIEAGKDRSAGQPDGAMADAMADLKPIEEELAAQMKAGIEPDDRTLEPLIERHRAWVARMWGQACPPEAYAGLADIYQHSDFRARYEKIAPGFADFLIAAMKAWTARQQA
ncbi:MerR family transcriptional regulator [Pelagibacterium sp. H642]|uniref:MerR family transcriptional regulator n=1 Tax=Pelagibacterium sp. H642 TaxID=1881069 RepID=UPI0028168018|nr:MerR family transcriptional regulator [Pelagibacterium sp. H642]WMT92719.1 MerR family transcriptional regulator [Pelagibacterium sp. H642]